MITDCNLFANSFVTSLIDELSNEIGLKSLTFFGLSTLGTSTIYESLMLCRHIVLL
jgi:hypothetical protein